MSEGSSIKVLSFCVSYHDISGLENLERNLDSRLGEGGFTTITDILLNELTLVIMGHVDPHMVPNYRFRVKIFPLGIFEHLLADFENRLDSRQSPKRVINNSMVIVLYTDFSR